MPFNWIRSGVDISKTKLGARLSKRQTVLEKSELRTLSELRRAAKNLQELKRQGFDDEDLKGLDNFASLARIFPSEVAITLQEAGAEGVEPLKNWTSDKFAKALEILDLDHEITAYEVGRFERLKKLLNSGVSANAIDGIRLDLDSAGPLTDENRNDLAKAGVETLDDWAALRDRVKLDSKLTRLLDARSRLAFVGVGAGLAPRLIEAGFEAAFDLAGLSDEKIKELAASLREPEENIAGIRRMSEAWVGDVAGMLRETKISIGGPSLEGLDLDLFSDLFGTGTGAKCVECSADLSAFSRFAYFIYLVRLTGKTLAELAILHQNLGALSPDSGRNLERQIRICIDVLSSADPNPLSHNQKLPSERRLIAGKMALLPLMIDDFASEVALTVPGASASSLAGRLREVSMVLEDAPNPSFTAAELQAIGNLLDQHLQAYFEAQVTVESAFASAMPAQIQTEAAVRLQSALDPILVSALPLLRDAHKKRMGKSDRELFGTFFIETDLPICETITRLDQAIRSLQAYLDSLKSKAATTEESEELSYESYEVWRANRMASFYPELRALWRDDVFVHEISRRLDRGSIIFDHTLNEPKLKEEVEAAVKVIREAKVLKGEEDDAAAVSFRDTHTVFYADFERGFNVINLLLAANECVQKALAALDTYQPGQALSHLANATGHMDNLARLVFHPTSQWITLGTGSALYDELASRVLKERREVLKSLFNELISDEKAIFTPKNKNIRIRGLLDNGDIDDFGSFRVDNSAFDLLDDGRVRKRAVDGSISSIKRARYAAPEAIDFSAYSVTVDFTLDRNLRNGDMLGLGARMDSSGGGGYQVLLKREIFREGDVQIIEAHLILKKGSNELSRKISKRGRAGVGSESDPLLPLDQKFTLGIQAYGSRIKGTITFAGETDQVEVQEPDSDYPTGTFALLASSRVKAHFSNLRTEFQGTEGWPPFYAPQRSSHELSNERYHIHRTQTAGGMAPYVVPSETTVRAAGGRKIELVGAKVEGEQLSFLFREGELKVDLDNLDSLLDKLLASAFYLRYAVIPVRLAQAYQQAGDYSRAADMLHIIYDDNGAAESTREIYPMLSAAPESFIQAIGADTRLMRLRLGEVYLALGEWYFRKDTPDSRYEARRLYERVLTLHTYTADCDCEAQIGELTQQVIINYLEVTRPKVPELHDMLSLVRRSVNTDIPINWAGFAKGLSDRSASLKEVNNKINKSLAEYSSKLRKQATVPELLKRGAKLLRESELRAATRRNFGTLPLANLFANGSALPGPIFTTATVTEVYTIDYTFCIPEAPLKSKQKRIACQMLQLLRSCRNILGFTNDFLPPLRFEALLALSRSFTELAHGAERDLLNFRQQFEQESLSLLQAENNLVLSAAEVEVESGNVLLAEGEVKIAGLQLEQANSTASHFEKLLEGGLSQSEKLALESAKAAAVFSIISAAPAVIAMLAAAGAAAIGGPEMATATAISGGFSSLSTAAKDISSAASMQASFERREDEWEFQLQQSAFGVDIAEQNFTQSTIRFSIAEQMRRIATLRRDFAMDTVQFLASKFLNNTMWLFMQGVMRDQYRTRLNYAITAAFMAERALAFELQNRSFRVIRLDYFDPTKDGVLGATQLQTDLATLENTRLSFTQRKHQLSKTVSLAQMMPAEFEIFRSGTDLGGGQKLAPGRLQFGTLMEMFDHDYPGHYMRLIKSVKMTVVALIPPNDGIRATLRNSGISRVVVGPPYSEAFREETIRRNPESVALSVPFQASGLFVFSYEGELLLPFEGSGVATDWVFELPKPANRFDYRTIADAFMTIEYTALESSDYRQQVIQRLNRNFRAERPFSFRHEFPDQWYDFHNPDLVSPPLTPMVAKFTTRRENFPPNLDNLKIQHVSLYFSRTPDFTTEIPVTSFRFKEQGSSVAVGGAATSTNGLINTRQSTTTNWQPMIGFSPVGEWELRLPNTVAMKDRFKKKQIDDILFIITYSGQTPDWPA